jgi:hypothetical protein
MMAPMLAIRFRWVRTTPFGVLVEPDENWMKATSSGDTPCMRPGLETSVTRSTMRERVASASTCEAAPLDRP